MSAPMRKYNGYAGFVVTVAMGVGIFALCQLARCGPDAIEAEMRAREPLPSIPRKFREATWPDDEEALDPETREPIGVWGEFRIGRCR